MVDDEQVAPDGSPVALYLAMPPHDALELVTEQVPPGGSVLDLGCGVGRLANPLAARGATVVGVDGCVLIERFHPDLLDDLDEREGTVDTVHVRHEVHRREGPAFGASAHYTAGGRTWTQCYEAVILDDAALDRLLCGAGLAAAAWLDDDERWLLAVQGRAD